MPPRLPASRALGVPAPSLLRPFSSTAASASPRDPFPQKPRTSNNSNNRLLSIQNDRPIKKTSGVDAATRMSNRFMERHEAQAKNKQDQIDYLREQKLSNDYLKQMSRVFQPGDVYSPHDLSPVEMTKWRRRSLRANDVVDALGIRPLDMYKNFSLIQEFTTSSGMISPSAITQLRPVNQRKIAKMIRRIQGMGLYPTIHDHPEMIRNNFFMPQRR